MKSFLIKLLKSILVISIFVYLYQTNNFDFEIFKKLLENYFINFILVILILLTIILGSWRWYLILKDHNIKISFFNVFQISYIGIFFNNFLFSNIGGDVLRVYYTSKIEDKNKFKNSFTIITDRICGFTGLIILGFFTLILILFSEKNYLISIGLIIFFFSLLILLKKLKELRLFKKVLNFINIQKSTFLKAILISIGLFLTVHLSIYYTANFIFEKELNILIVFFANFISSIIGAIPITPGGIGISELSFIFINNEIFNLNINNLANIIIYYRLITLIVSLPGIYFYFFLKIK